MGWALRYILCKAERGKKVSLGCCHVCKNGYKYIYTHTFIYTWVCESCSVMCNSLQPHGLYSPWNSPGQNTGVGTHSFLQRIFPTQESNPGLQADSLPAELPGKEAQYIYIHICMHIYIYIYTHTYIYMHTYICRFDLDLNHVNICHNYKILIF